MAPTVAELGSVLASVTTLPAGAPFTMVQKFVPASSWMPKVSPLTIPAADFNVTVLAPAAGAATALPAVEPLKVYPVRVEGGEVCEELGP